MRRRMTDEQADEWRMDRFGGEPARIDEDYFNAEQDAIAAMRAKSEAEYRRVNGGGSMAYPVQSDCLCRKCFGSGKVQDRGSFGFASVLIDCPECFGWGVEGPFILEPPAHVKMRNSDKGNPQ